MLGWRPLSGWEFKLLDAMLSIPFHGHEIYRRQLRSCLVREVDDEKQLEFLILPIAPLADESAKRGALVEARFADVDGMNGFYILHAFDRKLESLEKAKWDSSPIINETPELSSMRIMEFQSGEGPIEPL